MSPFLILAAIAAPAAAEPEPEAILVTASREPVAAQSASVPSSIIVRDVGLNVTLGLPMWADLIRTAPGLSVAVAGPKGSQAQVRIHGAEANHTLLFVDGIRFNDPAAGNEARFELLATDSLDRIDIVRGPQSALWGSEAIGGVVSAHTVSAPVGGYRVRAIAEYGALDSARLSANAATVAGRVELVATMAAMRSEGIDSFGEAGERDGFDNRSASLKAVFRPNDEITLGAVGHVLAGTSEYDGLDPVTFQLADTLDETRNRLGAGRAWVEAERSGWKVKLDGSYLVSSNRNRLDQMPLNRTSGRRFTAGGQVSRTLGSHRLTLAAEHQGEDFQARDQSFFGATDQDRSRDLDAAVGEWQAEWRRWLTTNVALRHDSFSAFEDATTLRVSATARPTHHWSLFAGYGEGIAQPSFYDLYGFFPGSFAGNPALQPERGTEFYAGTRWNNRRLSFGLNGFVARLSDEIIDVFDPVTFQSSTANAEGESRRLGFELDAEWRPSAAATLTFNYTYLDAEEARSGSIALVREVRRPRHGANLTASGTRGRLTRGAAITNVGKRLDTDFDQFPAQRVTLGDYLLASARLGWRLTDSVEAYGRVENGLDAEYQDVVGYNTPGRTVYAGLRIRLGH